MNVVRRVGRPNAALASRDELDDLRIEFERLRVSVELRAQAQENLVRAMLAEAPARAAEAVEGRIQLAACEAMAFAQQGLESHEAALRAIAGRLAEMTREPPPEAPARDGPPPAAGAFVIGAAEGEGDGRALPLSAESDEAFVAALAHLPILPGGATKLAAAHVVEFVSAAALAEKILPHWRSRLAPGGELVVVTLDGPAWVADLARAEGGFARARQRLGADGDSRPVRLLLDAAGLRRLLADAGFAADPPTPAPGLSLRIVARLPTT